MASELERRARLRRFGQPLPDEVKFVGPGGRVWFETRPPASTLLVGIEIVRLLWRGVELAIAEWERERGEVVDGVVVDED